MSPSSTKYKHGQKQEDYLLWKYKELKSVVSEKSLAFLPHFTLTGKKVVSCRFYSKSNSDIEKILSMFYVDGRKIVTREILDQLEPLGIAVWFMDDGKVDFGIRKTYKVTPEIVLCTDSFTERECELICEWFFSVYGIESKAVIGNKKYYRVRIKSTSVEKFLILVSPYILSPCFDYKIKKESSSERIASKNREKIHKLSCQSVVQKAIRGNDFLELSLLDRDIQVKQIIKAYRKAGFDSILKTPSETIQDFYKFINTDESDLFWSEKFSFSSIGNRFCLSHFPDFWKTNAKAKFSPEEIFNKDNYLLEVVTELLTENKEPTCNRLLQKLRNYRGNKAISSFMPLLAKAIYLVLAPEAATVFDFCGGYGGRLMAALCSKKIKSCCVMEPNENSYSGLLHLKHSIQKITGNKKKTEIVNIDSTGMSMYKDKTFDLCFTSVPYFDAEEYSAMSNQSSIMYPSYGLWFTNFLMVSINEAIRISKVVAINVNNTGPYKIADDLRAHLVRNKLFKKEYKIEYPKYGGGKKIEPLFVMES
jgi:hypothetical protein